MRARDAAAAAALAAAALALAACATTGAPPTAASPSAAGTPSAPSASTTPPPATPSPQPTSTSPSASPTSTSPSAEPSETPTPTATPTATQPDDGLPPITKLAKGQKPPQFVVVSFDGACRQSLFRKYLELGKETGSRFTFFLSGLCLVPEAKASLYRPPRHPVGTSAIGFAAASNVPDRIRLLGKAWGQGHEIGTHFLGHFCDATGVGTWTSAEWQSELDQARRFLDDWAAINGRPAGVPPLPFTSADWQGDRTPCLAGIRSQMLPVFERAGFTYDASGAGTLSWPRKYAGYDLWSFPLQRIPVLGYGKSALSMDYNFLAQQNGARIDAPPAVCDRIRASTLASYLHALDAVEGSNRAPLFIGNHFNDWVCNAFTDALVSFVRTAHAKHPDVRFVPFSYLARWLDAQDPAVLKSLQARGTAAA